jgi:RsmE family RNA methyltransferase
MNIVLFDREELSGPLPPGDRRARHITKILGVGPGDEFKAGIVNGPTGTGHVIAVREDGAVEVVLDTTPASAEGETAAATSRLHPVRLLLGHPRPIVLKRMLRDLSTLGVERIVVTRTELGEKSYLESKMWAPDSLRQLLVEGAEQAGVTAIPDVERAWSLRKGIDRVVEGREAAQRVVYELGGTDAEAGSGGAASAGPEQEAARVVAVGSERGWTEEEQRVLREAGFRVSGLGDRVLRTETAAVAAVVLSLRELGAV